MPLKARVSHESMIDTAFNIVRRCGLEKLTVRSVSKELHMTHMPIYSQFKSMDDLKEEVIIKSIHLLGEYEATPRTGILSLDHGIGYVLFAWNEPHLFAAINAQKYVHLQHQYGAPLFDLHVRVLSQNPRMKGFSNEQLRDFQFLAWIFVHGIASMKNWIEENRRDIDENKLIELIRDGSRTLTYGFIQSQKRFLRDDKNHG